MISEQNQFVSTIVKQYKDPKMFQARMGKLQQIESIHMYTISNALLYHSSQITYLQKPSFQTLQDIIKDQIELLPTQIKSIIWQITKFMNQCQQIKINHLRLQPKSIVLRNKYEVGKPIFIKMKDFAVGKEFNEVNDGKVLDFFQFLHPDLSVQNKMINFDKYEPSYDIWSLGVILYYIIYNVSPFCKQNKDKFSKTILRQYRKKQYEIPYYNNKYNSINIFISKCLSLDQKEDHFEKWQDVKNWILNQEQLYNEIDFRYKRFEDMAENHIRLMTLFSAIYCMIIDQCNNSPHLFWRKTVSTQRRVPFQVQIAQFTLKLMRVMHERFERIYGGHLFLLSQIMQQVLGLIKQKIINEQKYKGEYWLQKKFKDGTLNLQVIKIIQEICVQLKLQLSDLYPQLGSLKRIGQERKAWKSMTILYQYCNQIIVIFNNCKIRMKLIYEQFYASKILNKVCTQDFGYKSMMLS